jgi:predicted DNA-binding protein YlxM (UPF0122 family)
VGFLLLMGIYIGMKIIITERQYRLIQENESENEILIRKYYEMYNQLPKYNELTQLKNKKVGDIYPEYSKPNSLLSSWIKNFAPDFNQIINKIANENDILFKKSNKMGGQRVVSFDGKYRFESKLESVFYNDMSFQQIANRLDIKRERARQLFYKSIRRINNALTSISHNFELKKKIEELSKEKELLLNEIKVLKEKITDEDFIKSTQDSERPALEKLLFTDSYTENKKTQFLGFFFSKMRISHER